MNTVRYNVGDIVRMKKLHPCGSDKWEVTRTGMDFRINWLGFSRQVMLGRPDFEKAVKAIVESKA